MSYDTNSQENVYSSGDIAKLVDLKESTLRKYCVMLEKAGYKFYKNENGHRGFYNKDVIALQKLIKIKSHPDMTLEQACDAVVTAIVSADESASATTDIAIKNQYNMRYNALIEEFNDFREQQERFNMQLIDELKKQNEYIAGKLKERDELLMNSIRESQETKQILLEEAKKSRKWYKFWR